MGIDNLEKVVHVVTFNYSLIHYSSLSNQAEIKLGRNLFTSEGNLRGGLGSRPVRITPTRWCGNGCPHVRPHPGLTNLEFGIPY